MNFRKSPVRRQFDRIESNQSYVQEYLGHVETELIRFLRADDSRNFKRPFAKKRPRTDILNPGSLHLVGDFAFGGRF